MAGVTATGSYLELFCLPRVPHPFLPLPMELLSLLQAVKSLRVAHGWVAPLGLHPLLVSALCCQPGGAGHCDHPQQCPGQISLCRKQKRAPFSAAALEVGEFAAGMEN